MYKAAYPSKVTIYIVTFLALLHVFEVYQDVYKTYNNYGSGCGSKKLKRNLPKQEKVKKAVKPVTVPPPPDLPCCRDPEPEMPPSCRPEPVRSCPPPPSCHQRPPPSCGGEPEKVEPPKKKKKSGKKKSKTEGGKKKSGKAGDTKKKTKPKNEKVVREEPMCCH